MSLTRRTLRVRFWLESSLGAASVALLVLTLLVPDWIEAVFHVDPDQDSGSLERTITVVLVVAAITLIALARLEWRRPQRVTPSDNPN